MIALSGSGATQSRPRQGALKHSHTMDMIHWKGEWSMGKVGFIVALVISSVAFASEPGVPTWMRWEQTLASSKEYDNPFADVTVSVEYRGPDDAMFSGLGFWDGESTFKIRCMFPTKGLWTWRTSCSDPANTGLHNRAGTVEVVQYEGSNPLHRVELVAGQHQSFTNACRYLELMPTLPEDLQTLALPLVSSWAAQGCGEGIMDIDRAFDLTNTFAINFLESVFRDAELITDTNTAMPDDVIYMSK